TMAFLLDWERALSPGAGRGTIAGRHRLRQGGAGLLCGFRLSERGFFCYIPETRLVVPVSQGETRMVRMIDLIKRSGGGEEEPDRRPKEALPDSIPEEGPLRFPSPADFTRESSAPAPPSRQTAPPPAPPAPSQ